MSAMCIARNGKAFTRYKHHGMRMWVESGLLGLHRDYCLCYKCNNFFPNQSNNCSVAEKLLYVCKNYGVVTPVWECVSFA